MTEKEKAIEAIETAWEIINDKQPETTEEINLVRFAVNTARQLITQPTIDNAINVVEELKRKDTKATSGFVSFKEFYDIERKEAIYDKTLTALKGIKGCK